MTRPPAVVPVSRASALVLAIASVAGLLVFAWPLLLQAPPADSLAQGHTADAPFVFMVILPVLVVLVLAQIGDGGMDSRALAMLGVLSAVNAAVRMLGAGTNGIETVFFLLILAGRVFGPGFGFVLGNTSLFASALLTAGVGPFLPFQMLAAGWVGMLAGLLPRRVAGRAITGVAEIALLIVYGIVAAYGFGLLMNLWFWPFVTGTGATGSSSSLLSYVPGAPLGENLGRFLRFTLLTSTAWDTGRAVTNALALALLGPAVLAVLRRAVRRAAFGAPVTFRPADAAAATGGVPARPGSPAEQQQYRGDAEQGGGGQVDQRGDRAG
ncbi:ECF transporter S component [Nakamurella flavida]|uniref:ECF transporter S component n=1 Tax=Nakamurella flavida TaxID=363630 RepID=A0A938YR92_9ACTN|nr:ECF transporter S component [Nakamurella flavida]MBM9477460.1 ECF transporter S component [Nakamurella flavida]MDP9777393.1 energy-coupling factor transport system substrate-specific component [Nakamurella flavida]